MLLDGVALAVEVGEGVAPVGTPVSRLQWHKPNA